MPAITQTVDTITRDNVLTLAASAFIKDRMFDQVTSASAPLLWMAGGAIREIEKNQLMANLAPEVMAKETALLPLTGSRIEILVELGLNDSVRWVSPWESADTVENNEKFTRAYFTWKNIIGDVALSEIEEGMTDDTAIVDKMMEAQMENLKKAMVANLQSTIFDDGTANGGKAAGGFQSFIASDPTTGTVGGINRANVTAWRNKTQAQGGTLANIKNFRTLYHACSRGNSKETPQFIIGTADFAEQFEDLLSSSERNVQNKRLANLDFEHHMYRNKAIVTWDDNCPANTAYFLNKNGFKWAFNPNLNFKTRAWAFKSGSFVKETPVVFQCEFIPCEPNRLGVLTGITAV